VLDQNAVEDAAERLDRAEETRTPIGQLSLQYPEMTVGDAYSVQAAWTRRKLAEGRTLVGRKVGLTSRAMQQAVGITEPDYGAIYDDMVFPDGGDIDRHRFIAPRVEVELAFVLDRPLSGPGVTALDVYRATQFVTPALEILDARIQMSDPHTGHTRTIVDTISDNAADAGIVTGGRPVPPSDVDLRWIGALLYRNGVIEETGVSAGVLGDPARAVAWLANKLGSHGIGIEAGAVVLAGSFTRALWADSGDVIHADYGPLGTVTCRFDGTGDTGAPVVSPRRERTP
jgi:2-oxo-hept-3-ene-1,7-dioate hydratase